MGSFLTDQLILISTFGNKEGFVLLIVLLFVAFLYFKKYKNEANLLILTIISYPYALFLKAIFKKMRPNYTQIDSLFAINIYSFPSTHVVFYTVFWGFVIYLTFKLKKIDSLVRHAIRVLAVYFISFIGVSRVFLEFHWITDVIAGYIFGLLFLSALVFLDKNLK